MQTMPDRSGQAVETQGTHRRDGTEVGVDAHRFRQMDRRIERARTMRCLKAAGQRARVKKRQAI
jgi:hypothetical protein